MRIFDADEEATFIKRPNRFIIHANLNNKEVICHCPNTGRMGELLYPGVKLILERSKNPERKTKFSVVAVYKGELIVPTTSARANSVAKEIIIPSLFEGASIKPEVTYGKSRFDFMVTQGSETTYIEVKSCTLFVGDKAIFPDAPTSRGTKHLLELGDAVKEGYKGAVIFVVFNPMAFIFSPNNITDPEFSKTLESLSGKVQIIPFKVGVDRYGEVSPVNNPILPVIYN